jgi:Zn-finger nucleic acid-binding protein
MMFVGSLHCSRCGAKAKRTPSVADTSPRRCPRCRLEMESASVGNAQLSECARCGGLWVDVESFELIINEREQQSLSLGAASIVAKETKETAGTRHEPNKVQYVPCPECTQLMNRVNFARCSGVIVDVCKGHGTWFDRDELQRIVEFIRGGGLDASRAREKRELEEERQRLRQEQLTASLHQRTRAHLNDDPDSRSSVVAAARELLKLIID